MTKDKYENKSKMRILPFKLPLIFIALFTVGVLVYYNTHDPKSSRPSIDVIRIEKWTMTDSSGKSIEVTAPYRDDRMLSEDFTITATLPENISTGDYVCFINRGETEIYVGGELRMNFDRRKDMILPGGTVKNFYMMVPLTHADAGKEISMVRHKVDRRPEVVPEVFISDWGGLYSNLMNMYGTRFVLSTTLLVLSLVILIVGFSMCFAYRRTIGMAYAATGVFITALWLVSDSYLYPFIYGHYHIDGVINYICCILLPIPFILYIDSVQKGRYEKITKVLLTISYINFFVWSILHFTGIYPYPLALVYIDSVISAEIAAVFVLLILDIKKGYAREYSYTLMGFLGFLGFSIAEIIAIIFVSTPHEGVPMLMGLAYLLIFVIIQQVHDIRRMTAESEKAIRLSDAKTAFLANMSHEIRTPINSILGMNEMIIRENRDEKIDEYARNVQTSGKMLLSLVNDVLDFSQIESGRINVNLEPVSLSQVFSDITAISKERVADKRITFETVIEGDVPEGVVTDEVRLKQVLINLINNAVKYTDEGKVELNVGGRYLTDELYEMRLSVKDTGRGIKEEDRDRLFEAFSRADLTRNRNIEGTGLGLAIVKRILDSLDGTVSLQSQYLKGTVFDVLLPVKVVDKTPISPDYEARMRDLKPDQPYNEFSAPDARILAVDDNHSNLEIVRMFLNRVNIRPAMCRGGREAIEMCCDHKYDLILLDHMMPEIDGIEALKMIRTDKYSQNKDTPALVLTANALIGSDKMYLDAGFAGYLTKPIDSQKLIKLVRDFLPAGKVLEKENTGDVYGKDDKKEDKMEYAEKEPESEFIKKLDSIREMDVDSALINCGGDEGILKVVIDDILSDYKERADRLRGLINAGDYKNFGIESHALKGLMATVGFNELSERAKKHELAAKEGNFDFIREDSEGLIREFEEMCEKMG